MKCYRVFGAALALILIWASPGYGQQTAEELFQAALHQEEVQGELETAIESYQRILGEFPGNRLVGAKAQLHIGLCSEKLGLQDARQAYRRVIDDFPEHADQVRLARERLASLMEELAELDREPIFRKIEIASKPQHGVLSPDGTTLAFASGGSLWLVPIHGKVDPYIAGEPVRLTEPMGVKGITIFGNSLAWSGNGEWIAFNAIPDEGPGGIHLISSKGGETRQVPGVPLHGATQWGDQISLSKEGKTLAFTHADPLGGSDLLIPERPALALSTVPVEGGEAVRLASPHALAPAYSPDGRFLAFARQVEVEDPETPSYQQEVTGSNPVAPIVFIGKLSGDIARTLHQWRVPKSVTSTNSAGVSTGVIQSVMPVPSLEQGTGRALSVFRGTVIGCEVCDLKASHESGYA